MKRKEMNKKLKIKTKIQKNKIKINRKIKTFL